jgi:hypothetical protein
MAPITQTNYEIFSTIDMLLSAVSVLIVVLLSSEVLAGLKNYPIQRNVSWMWDHHEIDMIR